MTYEDLEEENMKLRKILRHTYAERSGVPFICGEMGEKDSLGLPDYFLICPTYGADIRCTTKYKKV